MKQVVHKIQTPCRCGIREIVVPFGAIWLDLQLQDGVLCLWYAKPDDEEGKFITNIPTRRRINVVHTGETFEGDWVWLRTIQHSTGMVYHVFVEAVVEGE